MNGGVRERTVHVVSGKGMFPLPDTAEGVCHFWQWDSNHGQRGIEKSDVSLNIPLSCRIDLLLKPFPFSLSHVSRGPDKERRRGYVRQLSQV